MLGTGPEQRVRRPVAPGAGAQALVELQGAGLLERVDHRVTVAAERDGAAGRGQPAGRADAVGEVPFGGRTHADGGGGVGEELDVLVRQVGRVHGGGARPEHAVVGEQPGRGDAVRGQAGVVLGGLLGEVDVQRRPAHRGPVRDGAQLVGRDGPHRVHGGAGPGVLARLQLRRAGRPGVRVAVAEPQLRPGRLGAEAGREVAGVEQGDPDTGPGGGLDQRLAHRVRVGVADPAGRVVEVVELPHRGDPGERHLGVDGGGERQVAVGVERPGDPVHGVAPGPEGAGADLDGAAQRPVEGVRVRVGLAGHEQPLQPDGARRAGPAVRRDLGDPAAVGGADQHVPLDHRTVGVREPGVLRPIGQ